MGAALVGARALFATLASIGANTIVAGDGPAAEMSSIVLAKGVSVLVLITVVGTAGRDQTSCFGRKFSLASKACFRTIIVRDHVTRTADYAHEMH
jgi:hypothetical protein